MTPSIKIDDLNEPFKAALNKHGWKRERRFLNFTTIENFIYHLPKIKDRTKRELAYNNLKEYLLVINEVDESEELDAKLGDELFSKYLLPLVNIYDRVGFTLFIRLPFLLLSFLIAEGLAFGFKAALWTHLLIDLGFLSYFLYQLYKGKQKKVYGLFI